MAADIEENQEKKEAVVDAGNSKVELNKNELSIKHPLEHSWGMWFFRMDDSKDWVDSQVLISTFETVEDFWALYNHIEVASKLPATCDYSLFKYPIKPMWEDSSNSRGGKWIITFNKGQRGSELDNFWLEVMLCLIGEVFDDDSDDICGAVVSVRAKGDRISLWTRDYQNEESVKKIGYLLKKRLGINPETCIGYVDHKASYTKGTFFNRYTV